MAADLSPLIDALPPEVRIRIYKEVLRAHRPLLVAQREHRLEVRYVAQLLPSPPLMCFFLKDKENWADWLPIWLSRFDTSLLFVCKSVLVEASDVFFDVNTIHLRRYSELQRLFKVDKRFRNNLRVLQNVRYLCLVDDKSGPISQRFGQWIHQARVDTHIKQCLTLPKLKECIFFYNRLPWQEKSQVYSSPTSGVLSIVKYLRSRYLQHELLPEYIDVGVAALQRSQGTTIKFVDNWLTTAWAQVKERGYINVVDEYIRTSTLKICRSPEEFYDSCAGPAIWCALYDCYTQVGDDGECQATRDLRELMRRRLTMIPMSSSHAKLPQDLPLRDVSPGLVGSDVMEWLSELLLHARRNSDALTFLRD